MQKYLIDADQINSLIFALSGEEVKEKDIEEWLGQFGEKAIAPHLEAGADYPCSALFDHMANEHGLTLTNTELGDIIHVARK